MSHTHSRRFAITLKILRHVYENKGSFDALAKSLGMERATLRLWLLTLAAEGYLRKNGKGEYAITDRGSEELQFHAAET